MNRVLFENKTQEWFTPGEIIDDVLAVMGGIDLDPCSPYHNGPVPADHHYTAIEDGLSQSWYGRVYMNPPYGKAWQVWAQKAINEYMAGNVKELMILIAARTDTKAWRLLSSYPWCGITGRLHFSGHKDAAPFPSAVFYLGSNVDRFCDVFKKWGPIYWTVNH